MDYGNLEAAQALWDTLRQILQIRGIDLPASFASWAALQAEKLPLEARADFNELCNKGCLRQTLAAILALIRATPHIESFWQQMVGRPYKRQKMSHTLEKAARSAEKVLGDIIRVEDEEGLTDEMVRVGRVPPSRIVSELRFYSSYISFAERLAAETETRSIKDVGKFLLTDYVKRATGQFNDRTVSGLLAAIAHSGTYNEVAHRMWRNRNVKKLQQHFSLLSDVLFSMSIVISRST